MRNVLAISVVVAAMQVLAMVSAGAGSAGANGKGGYGPSGSHEGTTAGVKSSGPGEQGHKKKKKAAR